MERKKFIKSLSVLAFSGAGFLSSCSKSSANPSNEFEEDVQVDQSCTETPRETEGPFPTKSPAQYSRSNLKKGDNIGVDMLAVISLVNVNANCAPLKNAIVDIWHCDVDGNYSQYGGTPMQQGNYISENWYRGRQKTDEVGIVKFETIFPGWYMGRSTHIHVHIYDESGKSLLVTQIAFQDSLSIQVNEEGSAYGYTKGIKGYTYNKNDNVFSDGVEREMSVVTGSLDKGFNLSITLKVKA